MTGGVVKVLVASGAELLPAEAGLWKRSGCQGMSDRSVYSWQSEGTRGAGVGGWVKEGSIWLRFEKGGCGMEWRNWV